MALLLDLTIKVSLLMIVTGAALLLMRRASAASRHMALTAALAAAVLLPAAKLALPALPLFVLAPESQPAPVPTTEISPTPQFVPAPVALSDSFAAIDQPVVETEPVPVVIKSGFTWSWSQALGLLWLVGAAAVLLSMAIAIVRVTALAREAVPVDDARMNERLEQLRDHFGIRRPVALLVSKKEWMPITWGLMRPAILLPASATSWPDSRLDAVLVHEMAHIARRDAVGQHITRVAVALFWFNPLVWLAARRARLERERACDDAVLARGLRATDYASDLVELAQTLVLPSRAAGVLAMARRSQLEQRVGALLDAGISRRGVSGIGRVCAIALILLMLPMAAAQLAARQLPPAPEPATSEMTMPTVQIDRPRIEPLDVLQPANVAAPAAVPEVIPQRPAPSSAQVALEAIQEAQQLLKQPDKWRLERDAMLRLLLNRAQNIVKDVEKFAEIGTATPMDAKPLKDTLDLIDRNAKAAANGLCMGADPFAKLGGGTCVNGNWTSSSSTNPATNFIQVNAPTDEQIASVKARFAQAIRNLDEAEVRWHNGMLTSYEIAGALRASLKVLTDTGPAPDTIFTEANFPNSTAADRSNAQALYELLTGRVQAVTAPNTQGGQSQEQIRFYTRAGTNTLSDAQVVESLKTIAAIKSDTDRANALLDLASRYAFTPEMVTLYVAAAKGITSPVEQARVFAQAIRVK